MKIYVGNMSYDTTPEELREAFAQFGEVSSVDVISDKYTGRAKGFAFVEMASKTEAIAAINALNDKELNGRNLNVNEARPRPERGDRGRNNRSRNSY